MSNTEGGAHYAAIGKVASNWAYLEVAIHSWCASLTGFHPDFVACFTAQVIGPVRKFDALISISRLLETPPDQVSEIQSISGAASGRAEERNRVVHDPWLWVEKG